MFAFINKSYFEMFLAHYLVIANISNKYNKLNLVQDFEVFHL